MFQDLRVTLESPSEVCAPATIVSMDGTRNPEGLKCGAQSCSEACARQVLARITAFYTPLISHDHHPRDVERRTEHLSAFLSVSSVWRVTDAGLPKMQSVQVAFLSASLPPNPLTTYGVRTGSEVGF